MENSPNLNLYEDVDSWETLMFLYNAALKEINTKIEILNDEFQHVHHYTPIEHIKSRINEVSVQNMVKHVRDIAGVRIICSFTSDIYLIADMIAKQGDLKIISLKDYIKHPKDSGYQSYHMLVSVPIYLSGGFVDTKVEIQIRTVAQDFWASLEHKIYYKFEGKAPDYISRELQECSKIVEKLDARMLSLNNTIQEFSGKRTGDILPSEA